MINISDSLKINMKKFETFKISSPLNKSLAPFALTRKLPFHNCAIYICPEKQTSYT